ncbi:HAMP domain-containing protein [Undibacterium parvum]|uniref:histidine kinase n=2 Tax=Undibacterium parvum TaxID=401471 RepID=A0A3Q9BSX6_9BURK|nr:ATP-binding protein [Undibacterium sp.]AZP13819.1 HAMP domain-containing protein [Undibacterium parvum]MCX7220181.1 ATP-binding protein [Burkholderiales bacterium]
MRTYLNSLDWLKSGLFWRTFFFLVLLVLASMSTWFGSFKIVERTPRAQQIAAQIISIVNITKSALTHSAPEKRAELLFDLASNEGIRIYLLEDNDQLVEPEATLLFKEVQSFIQSKLGKTTRFAEKMNSIPGFWISFEIDGDQYWLRLEQDRLDPGDGLQFAGWAAITLFLTLIGAVFISRLINDPLSRLSAAARMLAKGKRPEALPERGPSEIRETNASFNQMVEDLVRIDSDRAVILAGISHDLRTPLARMQLEVEMANLSKDARLGMQSDLAQMDGIIGQFLDYAKPLEAVVFDLVNISELLSKTIEEASRLPEMLIRSSIGPNIQIPGNKIELYRLFNNLIENARRYGHTPGSKQVKMDIQCHFKKNGRKPGILLSFRDYGVGVPDTDLTRLLKPFTRVDVSRSQANGSGLGLAIVEKIIKRHGGRIRISNHVNGGFLVVIAF